MFMPKLGQNLTQVAPGMDCAGFCLVSGGRSLCSVTYRSALFAIIVVLTSAPEPSGKLLASPLELSRGINRWLVIGPFPNADYSAFDADLIDEANCEPALEQEIGGLRWKEFDDRLYCRNYDDYCDLYMFFHPSRSGAPPGGNEWKVAYAHTYVWSPEAKSVQLLVGSNDGFKAWVNGKLVSSVNGQFRQAARDQDKVPVKLEAGWNRLLLKLANAYRVWGFYARLVDGENKKLEGLEYSTRPPTGDLEVITSTLPCGYTEWPFIWLALDIPLAEQKNTLAEIEQNTPSASPWRFEAAGGTPPYQWKVADGELPSGLSLDGSEGELLGRCDRKQTASFVIEVTDAIKNSARRRISIEVRDRPNLWHDASRLGALIHNSTSPDGKGWLGDPERQAALMSLAGYSYAAPMSKNNGGLAYWPTKAKNSAGMPTGAGVEGLAGKDPLGSLTTALRNRGIKVGYYYPLIETDNNGLGGDDYANNFPRYMDVRLAQIEELCVNYHPAVMWLDGANVIFTSHQNQDGRTNHEFDALYSLIKTFEPDCLVMANSGGECEYGMGDIDVLVCESEGSETLDWYWGAGQRDKRDTARKKCQLKRGGSPIMATVSYRMIVSSTGKSGCELPFPWHPKVTCATSITRAIESVLQTAARLKMAEWLHRRIHTLDGTKPGPLRDDVWGYDVIKGNTLYLHILQNERGKYGFRGKSVRGLHGPMKSVMAKRGYAPSIQEKLKVGPIDGKVVRVWQEPIDMPLPFAIEGEDLIIDMRPIVVDEIDTIIGIELGSNRVATTSTAD